MPPKPCKHWTFLTVGQQNRAYRLTFFFGWHILKANLQVEFDPAKENRPWNIKRPSAASSSSAAAACAWGSLWLWIVPLLLDGVTNLFYGFQDSSRYTLATPFTAANLGFGLPWFWDALLILALAAAAVVLAILGLRQTRQQDGDKTP